MAPMCMFHENKWNFTSQITPFLPATDRPAPQGLHRDVRGDAVQVRPPHLVRALRVQGQADHHTEVDAVQEVFAAVPITCELAPRSVVTCQISG